MHTPLNQLICPFIVSNTLSIYFYTNLSTDYLPHDHQSNNQMKPLRLKIQRKVQLISVYCESTQELTEIWVVNSQLQSILSIYETQCHIISSLPFYFLKFEFKFLIAHELNLNYLIEIKQNLAMKLEDHSLDQIPTNHSFSQTQPGRNH